MLIILVSALALLPVLGYLLLPGLIRTIGGALGWYLRKKTAGRRSYLAEIIHEDQDAFAAEHPDSAYVKGLASADAFDGYVAFFHPFSNAGGGGERVLWAAIRATQSKWPHAKCIVYTGDHDVTKETIVKLAKTRFNIDLHAPTILLLYLTTRPWVLPSSWPYFTLLGQSLGSIVVAWDAFHLLAPDLFVDTMGYAFALGLARFLFPYMPLAAYVHYPTISTDMLESLDPAASTGSLGVNAGQGTGLRGTAKQLYWRLFAALYARVGACADLVMTNSSWTHMHIQKLWGPHRRHKRRPTADSTVVLYPPVAVTDVERAVDVSEASETARESVLLYIAQFRPEKNHRLILEAFAAYTRLPETATAAARLVLVGSVRDDADSKLVYQLRLLANELGVKDRVEFHLDAPWPQVLDWLRRASVGVNGMWNEHFGIGVVEYQAAGLVSVVHNSGGPRMDIVVDIDGEPTGFHATTATEFAVAFDKALSLPNPLAVRRRARQSAQRFTDEEFDRQWIGYMAELVARAR